MNRRFLIIVAVLVCGGILGTQTLAATDGWVEYPTNPVFAPTKAYYPRVIYDANEFSGHGTSYYYKMWYATGSAIRLGYSDDGIHWVDQGGGDLSTLTNAAHPVVVYDAGGFGGSAYYYKIWYWDSASEYIDPIGARNPVMVLTG